jgi:hypothetical protein
MMNMKKAGWLAKSTVALVFACCKRISTQRWMLAMR